MERPRCCAASIWWWMRGEIVAVLGSNGVGKSTLNRAISGVLRARKGSICFAGHMIEREKPGKHRLAWTHSRAGRALRLSQSERQGQSRSWGLSARAQSAGGKIASAYSAFSRVLPSGRSQRAGSLSGGEQQMLAIGRGLMAEPVLLILDEPSLGLSPLLVEELFALIQRINRQGIALLLVEQNVVQSLEVAHRAYILENGSVVLDGASDHLRNDPNLKRAYLGL